VRCLAPIRILQATRYRSLFFFHPQYCSIWNDFSSLLLLPTHGAIIETSSAYTEQSGSRGSPPLLEHAVPVPPYNDPKVRQPNTTSYHHRPTTAVSNARPFQPRRPGREEKKAARAYSTRPRNQRESYEACIHAQEAIVGRCYSEGYTRYAFVIPGSYHSG